MSRLLRAIRWTGWAVLLASLLLFASRPSLAQGVSSRADFTTEIVLPNEIDLGSWYPARFCPPDEYVVGFDLRFEDAQGLSADDHAAVNLRATCSSQTQIYSSYSYGDTNSTWYFGDRQCASGNGVDRVSVRTESFHPSQDNTGVNDVRMYCEDDSNFSSSANARGSWSPWVSCGSSDEFVCGLRVRQEFSFGDGMGLTAIRFQCCTVECGNGILGPGEACDDGNNTDGDCCSSTCQLEADGISCSDGDVCNGDEVCGGGICAASGPLVCDDGDECTAESCDASTGCYSTPIEHCGSVVIAPEPGFSITWDGNAGDFFGGAVPDNLARSSNGAIAYADPAAGGVHAISDLNNGVYGNSDSWFTWGNPGKAMIAFGKSIRMNRIAFGRDNLGVFTDRWEGTYTLHYTNFADPDLATPITGNATTGWAPLGVITLSSFGSGLPFPPRRHEFQLGHADGTAITASGLRFEVTGNGPPPGVEIAIDEIEVYGPAPELPSMGSWGLALLAIGVGLGGAARLRTRSAARA